MCLFDTPSYWLIPTALLLLPFLLLLSLPLYIVFFIVCKNTPCHTHSSSSHLRAFFEGISLYCPMLVLYYMRRSSLTFTSRHLATSIRFCKLGCALLVHHLDTVAWSTPICSANHLFVRWYPPRDTRKSRGSSHLSKCHFQSV